MVKVYVFKALLHKSWVAALPNSNCCPRSGERIKKVSVISILVANLVLVESKKCGLD